VALTKCDAVMRRALPRRAAKSPRCWPAPAGRQPGVRSRRPPARACRLCAPISKPRPLALGPRRADGRFRLAIDRCFTLSGIGTVVTGTAFSGRVGAGDTAMITPAGSNGLKARVASLHVQDRPAESGQAGERCALALSGDFEKRMWRAACGWSIPPAAQPLTRFQAELRVPASHAGLKHWTAVHVHLGAADIIGRVALLDTAQKSALVVRRWPRSSSSARP
jgi:selenocysteine-specific translation elongation factor